MTSFSFPVKEGEVLAKYTSWRIGGAAKYFVEPESIDQLNELARYLKSSKEAFAFLGNGSNLLIPDEGFDGWIIRTHKLAGEIEFLSDNCVKAPAGYLNSKVVRACANNSLGGLGFLAGVPGTIGGAVIMNAGIGSACVDDVIESVESFDFQSGLKKYERTDLKFSYRQQHFLEPTELVVSATFKLQEVPSAELKKEIAESAKYRKEAQPIDKPSCGSVFRNPDSAPAWKLIDAAGLKGKSIGGAAISEKHANWIINLGNAKMTDVLNLIELMKERVKATSGVELEEEVKVLKPVKLS